IKYTRAMLNAALDGELEEVETYEDPFFGLRIPKEVPGVPSDVLDPKNTWADKNKYDETAKKLAKMFHENFKEFEDGVSDAIKNAGPKYFD
ncbi:MAG: phosphoenolpyruvate carboxykinase (ATP), partial [Melioribacteraceae bacterium]|nr:phosphoenolpyruvate carboxykinase (ATP) [Melioribacteraceae bacterium]